MKPRYPFLRLTDVTEPIADQLCAAAESVIRSGWFLNGPHNAEFERNMARICGTDHCVAVSNGLDALRLSLRALIEAGRMVPGDEVIVPANTYIASILPVSELGLRPVPVEPSERDFNLDWDEVERHITPRTRAVMVVHLYGTPCWNTEAARRLKRQAISIIEDNAQAIGASAPTPGLRGTYATGGLGDIAATSFYPTKNIGALGDAGAVTTSDPELARMVRTLSQYGSDRRYHNVMTGYNNRMDEIQAAMLNVKLKYLDETGQRRGKAARAYTRTLTNPRIIAPRHIAGATQVWHQYVVRVPGEGERDRFREWLADNGVETDIHYATPPHLQPCYAGLLGESYPLTERLASEIVSLPIGAVTPDDARAIANIINRFK